MKEQINQDKKEVKIKARLLICDQQWIFYHDPSENKYNWIEADCAITSNLIPTSEIYKNDENNCFFDFKDLQEKNKSRVSSTQNSAEKVSKDTKQNMPELNESYFVNQIIGLQEKLIDLEDEKCVIEDNLKKQKIESINNINDIEENVKKQKIESLNKIKDIESTLSSIIKESLIIGKSVKLKFLDRENNLIKVKQFGEHMELLNGHSKTIEGLKNNVVETTEPKSLARVDKHLWNVHQFYIDLLIKFIDYVLQQIKREYEAQVSISELDDLIKMIHKENKSMLEAGREKIRDYEMMILETRRLGNEEFEKLKDVIKQRDNQIAELKENSYRKS